MCTYSKQRIDGSDIALESEDRVKAVLLNWTPTDKPVVSYEPFVIRIPVETNQAIQEFQMGQLT